MTSNDLIADEACQHERQIQHRLKDEEVSALIADYQSGVAIKELVIRYRISKWTIYAHLDRRNIQRRRFA